jgi:hypothetical protein
MLINVRRQVDKLFAKYPKTNETLELKEEVIGNMEAEIEDLQSGGLTFEEALRISIGKMARLDELIGGIKFIKINKVIIEMLQWTLIYTLIAWILTIPLSIFDSVRRTSWILLLFVIIIGIIYFVVYITRGFLLKKSVNVDLFKIVALRKFAWIIWFAFIIIKWGMITALLFGSNIWFRHPISINGPYEFAGISVMYAIPIMTVIVPLLMNKLKLVIEKVGEDGSSET